MNVFSLVVAFFAGLLSFLSPCVLPLVPGYIAFIAGNAVSQGGYDKKSVTVKTLWFVAGFSVIFILMGATASAAGGFFAQYQDLFRIAGGILIILFGVHLTGIIKIKQLYREKRAFGLFDLSKLHPGLVGMAFAAGWTPCIGPVLSSILIIAGNQATIPQGVLLLLAYSLGLGLPFLLSTLAVNSLSSLVSKINPHTRVISAVSGILLIVMGILVLSNRLTVLAGYLSRISFF